MNLLAGELVTRKSYDNDILFKIKKIKDDTAILRGVEYRLEADAPVEDLVRIEDRELKERRQLGKEKEEFSYRLFRQDYQLMKEKREFESTEGYKQKVSFFRLPIKVLHLDGDPIYLKKCIGLYQRLGIQVHGVHLNEKDMPTEVGDLIEKVQPEVVVVTEHDAYFKKKG